MNRIILRNIKISDSRFKISQSNASTTCALCTKNFHTNNQNENSLKIRPKDHDTYSKKLQSIERNIKNVKLFKVWTEKYERNHLIGSYESKEQCLRDFKDTSDHLLKNFEKMRGLRKMQIFPQLKHKEESEKLLKLKVYFGNNETFNRMINFMHANLDKFDTHEKSTIFKLLSVIDQLAEFEINKHLRELLLKLEIDVYDNVDKCNLYDINNYNLIFKHFKNSNTFFYKKSLDSFYRYLLNQNLANKTKSVENESSENIQSNETTKKAADLVISQPEVNANVAINTNITNKSNQLIDDINNRWLEHEHLFKTSLARTPVEKNYLMSISIMKNLPFITTHANSEFMLAMLNDSELKKLINTNVDVLAHLLISFNTIFPIIPFSTKKVFRNIIKDNYLKILEHIQRINNYEVALKLVEVLIDNFKANFTHSATLLTHFQSCINHIKDPFDFSLNLKILSKLLLFRNDIKQSDNRRNVSNFFFSVFDPLYSGIIEDFDQNSVKIGDGNKKNTSEWIGFAKTSISNYNTKIDQLAGDMNVFSITLLSEAVKLREFNWLMQKLYNLLANKFDEVLSNNINNLDLVWIYLHTWESFNRLNRSKNAKLILSDISLDNIMRLVTSDKNKMTNLSYDKYSKFITTSVSTILYNPSYATKVLHKLAPKIDQILQDNNTENLKIIANAFTLNYDYYYETNPVIATKIMNTVFKCFFTKLLDFNFNTNSINQAKFRINNKNIVNSLTRIDRKKMSIDHKFLASLSMENSNKKLDEYLNNFQSNMDQVSNNNSYEEVKRYLMSFEKTLLFYSNNLEIIARLLILANHYNPQMILDICSNCIKNLTIFGDSLFDEIISGNIKMTGFNSYDILDFLTFYGLFNYFDTKVISENEKLSDAFNENINKLKILNEKFYKKAKKKNYIDNTFLIEYNLRLLNMGIQQKEAINDLFNKIKSVEDINTMFNHLDNRRILLVIKLIYLMNQALCIEFQDLNLIWFFENCKPVLPHDSEKEETDQLISDLFKNQELSKNPSYEYNLTADYEIATDDDLNIINSKSNKVKHRIPILFTKDELYYSNMNRFVNPFASYMKIFKKLYPVVTINCSKVNSIKSKKGKIVYIKECIRNGIAE